jgi:hypothetical protein
MSKSMVAITILALSTSGALAAHHRTHHHQAMTGPALAGAPPPAGVWMGGVSNEDRQMYGRNLRESGYNPKSNFDSNGNMKSQ